MMNHRTIYVCVLAISAISLLEACSHSSTANSSSASPGSSPTVTASTAPAKATHAPVALATHAAMKPGATNAPMTHVSQAPITPHKSVATAKPKAAVTTVAASKTPVADVDAKATVAPVVTKAPVQPPAVPAPNAIAGSNIYNASCASCHGASGKGMPSVFPPLAGNVVVTGSAATLIHIVKYGLEGSISVHGTSYNGQMPAWSGRLSDAEISNVLSFMRSAWGNSAAPITAVAVSSVAK